MLYDPTDIAKILLKCEIKNNHTELLKDNLKLFLGFENQINYIDNLFISCNEYWTYIQ